MDKINKKNIDIQMIINEEALLEDLDLSVGVFNCLKRAGIHTLKNLLVCTEEELMSIPHLKEKDILEIKSAIAKIGNSEIKLGFNEEKFKLELLKYYIMQRDELDKKINSLNSEIENELSEKDIKKI